MSSIMNIISLGVALLPTIVIMAIVLGNARHKREPFKKVASVFGISALSVIPAAIIEIIGSVILAVFFGLGMFDLSSKAGLTAYQFAEFMLIVGPAEEACKYFTFKWIIFHDRDFDNTYDGIIYGAASALGFATLENLMYVFLMNDSPLETAVMRALLSVPMHAVTGIVMGYWFGISKYRRYNNVQPVRYPERKAFIFAFVLHGLYDFDVTLPSIYEDSTAVEIISMGLLIVIMIMIYILIGRTVHRAKVETHNIYNRYYYEQLDGHFQDMFGGKTSEKRRHIFGMPLPMFYGRNPQGFNPYNPYAGMNIAPQPPVPQQAYVYGTQQPYNPYYMQPVRQPQPNVPNVPNVPNGYPPVQQPYAQPMQPMQQYGQQPFAQNVPPDPMQNRPPMQPYPPVQPMQPQAPFQPMQSAPTQPAPPPVPKIFCVNCGAEQKPGTRYCRICGSKIEVPEQNA